MIKLLVIDDHPVTISGIKSILNGYAEIVYSAHNIKESLNFNSNNFDLIILDLLLDENNPVENVEKLKNTYPNIPIVIFTCEDSVIWKRKMLDAGVSAYIVKSSDKINIKSVLDNVIKNKHIKEDINKYEYYFKLLLDNMIEGVGIHQMIFDENNNPIDYIILDVNKSYETILNLKRENVINKLASEVYGVIPALKEYSDVVINKKPLKFKFYFSNTNKYYEVSASHWNDIGFVSMFTDITNITIESNRNKALLNAIPDMMFMFDSECHFIDFYSETTDKLYSDPKFFIGKLPEDVLPIDIAKTTKEKIEKVIITGEQQEFTYDLTIKGKIHNFESRLVLCGDNMVLSIVRDITSNVRNITERIRIEKLQSVSNEILKVINSNISLKDMILYVIKSIQKSTGFSAIGIRLRKEDDFPYYDYNGFSDDFISTENTLVIKDKNGICKDENGNPILECSCGMVILGKVDYPTDPLSTNGGSLWTNNSFQVLKNSDDKRINPRNNCIHAGYSSVALIPIKQNKKIVGVLQLNEKKPDAFSNDSIKIFEGIGEIIGGVLIRKQTEDDLLKAKEKAEESEKMKMAFLSNMSHDLRTPINSIIGFSELLKENNLNKIEKLKYLDIIIQNGDILTNLINDIIDITKIDSGSLKVQKIETDLNKLLQELRIQHSKLIKSNKVKINIDIDLNNNIYILSDKYRLKQILMNLLSNSIKFTKKGYIKFGYTVLKDNKLKIYVKDTGIGISEDNLKIVFDRFSQFGQPGSKLKGAGLGLPISKSLVDLLDFGELKVESELDKGSTFYFEVPYIIKDEIYIDEKDNNVDDLDINLKNKNILIVEDDTNFQLILKSYLKQTKCEIFTDDGIYALDIIKNNKIDIVLLDLGLGEIDGYNILHEMKSYNKDIIVIVQSAFAIPEFRKKAFDLGCDDFLSKPVTRHQIFNTILKHI